MVKSAPGPRLAAIPASFLVFGLLGGLGRSASAQERDEWQLVHLDDAKVGFSHRVVEKIERDGKPHWKVTTDGSMTLNRLGSSISIVQSGWQIEDEAGRPVEMRSEMNTSATTATTHVKVHGDKAEVTRQVAGPVQVQTIDWDPAWLGELAIERLTREKVAAGEKEFSVSSWSPDAGPIVATTTVHGRQKVQVPTLGERELLLLKSTIDVQPGVVIESYLDDAGEAVMTIARMGMNLVSVRSDKAACLAAFANPDSPEVFEKLSPRSNVPLPAPYDTDEVVLRLTATQEGTPLPELADERQTIVEQPSPGEVLLRIERVVPQQKFTLPIAPASPLEQECLEPSLQIESDHPLIVELAKKAAGGETDAWAAACKLERFVKEYITSKDMGAALLWTAAQVAEKRAGDCTEHGVLLSALCRAVGIPSRVAVGLLYFKGIWGGHMWAEVALGGKWYALDGVLGRGSVDAAHLRLAADSLKSAELARVFSNVTLGFTMKMEIVSFRHGEKEVEIGKDLDFSEVDGSRYRHLLYGISLTAPEGYAIEPNDEVSLTETEIVELEAAEGGKTPDIAVQVIDVTYDFTLDHVKDQILARNGITRLKSSELTIDERPGLLLRGRKDGRSLVIAAVLRDETLVLLSARLDEGEEEAPLLEVVASIDLDG